LLDVLERGSIGEFQALRQPLGEIGDKGWPAQRRDRDDPADFDPFALPIRAKHVGRSLDQIIAVMIHSAAFAYLDTPTFVVVIAERDTRLVDENIGRFGKLLTASRPAFARLKHQGFPLTQKSLGTGDVGSLRL